MEKSYSSPFLSEEPNRKPECHQGKRKSCFTPLEARTSSSDSSELDGKSKWNTEEHNVGEEQDTVHILDGLVDRSGAMESKEEDITEDASNSEAEGQEKGTIIGHEARWENMYDRLVAYKEKHGHCLVPNRYKDDVKLGSWVSTQRRQRKALRAGRFDARASRIERLDAIGFAWISSDPRPSKWDVWFQQLMTFHREHGR
jgi:Helicase associated domain